MTDRPNILHIPDTYDTAIQKTWIREVAERHYPRIKIVRLDRDLTVQDELYHEAVHRRFKEPVETWAYVDHIPSKKVLTRFGLDQPRDVLFHITTLHLQDLGILEDNDTFLIGDLILWGGDDYEVKVQTKPPDAYWMNTNIPFFVVLGCDYYRRGT